MTRRQKFIIGLSAIITIAASSSGASAEEAYCNPAGWYGCAPNENYCEWPVAWHCRTLSLLHCGENAQNYSVTSSHCGYGPECYPGSRMFCITGED